jgi:hypothetical protein
VFDVRKESEIEMEKETAFASSLAESIIENRDRIPVSLNE